MHGVWENREHFFPARKGGENKIAKKKLKILKFLTRIVFMRLNVARPISIRCVKYPAGGRSVFYAYSLHAHNVQRA